MNLPVQMYWGQIKLLCPIHDSTQHIRLGKEVEDTDNTVCEALCTHNSTEHMPLIPE